MADPKINRDGKSVVAKPIVATPASVAPTPSPVAPAPVAALAAAPVQAAEATRATVEDAGAAVARAMDTVADHAAAAVPPAQPTLNPLKGMFDMASTFDPKAFAPNADTMKSMFGDAQGRAKEQLEKSTKIVEEMSEFAKGNVEAMMASGRVAAKGTETMAQEAAEFGKKSFESATAAFKSFAQAKSPTELFKLQSDYARASFDAMVAESSKVTEAWLKLAGEVAQPLSSRVAVAAEKVKAPTAL